MPFGLTNALAIYIRLMNEILYIYLDIFIVYYLNNILVYSNNEEQYKGYVKLVLKALRKH